LGEKTFFHDASVKVPMIIYDPSEEANATRGATSEALVECIDLAPTFVDVAGGDSTALDHILEGHSLLPLLRGGKAPARDYTVCEYDYSATPLAAMLELHPDQSRMFMVADHRWKMIHFESGHRPMLFDLQADPNELSDLGGRADHAEIIAMMYDKLNTWARRPSARTTMPNATFIGMRTSPIRLGVLIGVADATEAINDEAAKYIGRKAPDKRGG
jgi:arylsulfatase A-like enzyme